MNSILRRRRALMGAQNKSTPRIPAEYQEVEWIEISETTGMIDTGIIPSSGIKIWLDAKFNYNAQGYGILTFISDALSSGNYKNWAILHYSGNIQQLRVFTSRTGGNDASVTLDSTTFYTRHIYFIDSANGDFSIDDTTQSIVYANLPTVSLKLGIANGNKGAKPTIWGCWYQRDGDPETYYIIPCYRKADSVNGVYCTETEAFCAASGSTSVGGNV